MNYHQFEPKLKDIPKIPDEFGEDGGNFYRYYDALADELDEDMVKSLKAQLDGILIFAGLFAGVNSAFLALTLPEMKADPADDTNALLLHWLMGGNGTIQSAEDLPSATFAPSPGIFPVNVLFSLSLTLAIISSFLAVLGQQWLVYYRKQSGGGAEYQRWEQLRRYLGAQRWRLELILDDILPALLQFALVIFCAAFVLYLRTLSKTIYYVITTPMAIALSILILMAIAASLDQWCPFKSPSSHFVQLIIQAFVKQERLNRSIAWVFIHTYAVVSSIIILAKRLISNVRVFLAHKVRSRSPSYTGPLSLGYDVWRTAFNRGVDVIESMPRPGEGIVQLKALAAKRVLCTSEDYNALIYTGINILAIKEGETVRYLLDDNAVHQRMEELGRGYGGALSSIFSYTYPYLLLGGQSVGFLVKQDHRHLYNWDGVNKRWQEYVKNHPLKETVNTVCNLLDASTGTLYLDRNKVVGLLLYFELLGLLLDERSGDEDLSKWFDRVIANYPASKLSTPLVIGLVAHTIRILDRGLEPALVHLMPSAQIQDLSEGPGTEQLEEQQKQFLNVQRRRLTLVERVLDGVGWEVLLERRSLWDDLLERIDRAFQTYGHALPRRYERIHVWLLEQALLISTQNRDQSGWEVVARTSIDMLCLFDMIEETTPGLISPQNNQDSRNRCTKTLTQCLKAVVTYLGPNYVLEMIYPCIGKASRHLERLVGGLTPSANSDQASTLSSWLEIRDMLGEPSQSRLSTKWPQPGVPQFEQAYPRLKKAFDSIQIARLDISTVPRDGSSRKAFDTSSPSFLTQLQVACDYP